MKQMLVLLTLIISIAIAEDSIIEYSGHGEHYTLLIQDSRIVGGFAKGTNKWEVWGGAKMGDRLQVLLAKDDKVTDDNAWLSHTYRITNKKVILETTVTKSGKVVSDRSIKYTIVKYDRK